MILPPPPRKLDPIDLLTRKLEPDKVDPSTATARADTASVQSPPLPAPPKEVLDRIVPFYQILPLPVVLDVLLDHPPPLAPPAQTCPALTTSSGWLSPLPLPGPLPAPSGSTSTLPGPSGPTTPLSPTPASAWASCPCAVSSTTSPPLWASPA